MTRPEQVLRTYITLTVMSTAASSMIWGVNTLFLLDAGLSIGQAFVANAFFTVGMVLFEVPTGVVADTVGRRTSYLLGTITLIGSTLLYLLLWQRTGAPFAARSVQVGKLTWSQNRRSGRMSAGPPPARNIAAAGQFA